MNNIKKYVNFVFENIQNMLTPIGNYKDTFLNSEYTLATSTAKILSDYLKENVKKRNLDIDYFNSAKKSKQYFNDIQDVNIEKNPPTEIYEYQPFFLMKKESGEYLLLDGYRRIIWYNAPTQPILVRVYNEKDLTSQQILKLLIYLNHFKFYGGSGKYFDRGFSLAFKIIFDIDVTKIYNTMDGYLSNKTEVKTYLTDTTEGTSKNISVKDRILNPMFIEDMYFIQELNSNDILLNNYIGYLIYQTRLKHPSIKFDSNKFIHFYKLNKNIDKCIKKYQRGGDYQRQANNELIEEYKNIFSQMFGGTTKESYQDLLDKAKTLSKNLKDDGYVKLTGNSKYYEIENQISDYYKSNNKYPEFKIVIFPNNDDENVVGIYNGTFRGYEKSGNMGSDKPVIYIEETKYKISTRTTKDYYQVSDYKRLFNFGSSDQTFPDNSYKIEVFVKF